MIETLRIENLAVLEGAELEFGPGLNVLTGETGAGKSIVLGALTLLAGARASQELIREGADAATVEAVFRADGLGEVADELARRGISLPEDGLVVWRSVSRSGRSRARVGGELVPASTLGELFAARIEVSSQHESQQLLQGGVQARLLDAAGGLLESRAAVAREFEGLRALDGEMAGLRAAAAERVRREDFLRFQLREIEEARVEKGEFDLLQQERARLGHAERLCQDAALAARLLAGDPAYSDDPAALDQLAEALRRVVDLVELDGSLDALVRQLRAARAELEDAAHELGRYASAIEADPERLREVEERLDLLERLRRKYGPDEDAIAAFRDRTSAELAMLDGADERLAKLEAERRAACDRLARVAATLSTGRARAAPRLARAVERRLAELAMPEARFEIALEPWAPPEGMPSGPSGREAVEFRFSANPGEPLHALRRVASGGELSRVFLAMKSALREGSGGVLVFDEVDAGIGGRVAERVGRVLAELAHDHQILCITHLPQIAVCADAHFRVAKQVRRGRSAAVVARLEGEARVEEIARMAAGEKVGEATRRHARELLGSRTS